MTEIEKPKKSSLFLSDIIEKNENGERMVEIVTRDEDGNIINK